MSSSLALTNCCPWLKFVLKQSSDSVSPNPLGSRLFGSLSCSTIFYIFVWLCFVSSLLSMRFVNTWDWFVCEERHGKRDMTVGWAIEMESCQIWNKVLRNALISVSLNCYSDSNSCETTVGSDVLRSSKGGALVPRTPFHPYARLLLVSSSTTLHFGPKKCHI